jgi:hypothetical protein
MPASSLTAASGFFAGRAPAEVDDFARFGLAFATVPLLLLPSCTGVAGAEGVPVADVAVVVGSGGELALDDAGGPAQPDSASAKHKVVTVGNHLARSRRVIQAA